MTLHSHYQEHFKIIDISLPSLLNLYIISKLWDLHNKVLLLYLRYFIVIACISVFWSDSSVPHVSHVFHFLMMQTQNLKDVSTAWQVWTKMSFFYFPFHSYWTCIGSCHRLLNVSHGCFFGGGVGYRTGDISWLIDKGSQWVHVWRSRGQIQSPPRYGHSWCWDSEQLSRPGHTLTHTRWREDCWRHTSLRMAVKLGFVPERHFNVTILSCFTTMQYWIQPLSCWKMYLPVHFVYKKPWMGIGFFFVQIALYIGTYNPECTVTK